MSENDSICQQSGVVWYRRPDFWFWAIAAAGLLLRLEYLREFSAFDHFSFAIGPDVQDYHERAIGILNGELLPSRPHIHAPLYSFFLALGYKLTGTSIPWMRAIQLLLNFGAYLGFAKILQWRKAPAKIVLPFLAFAMFTPALIFHQAELISESLLAILLCLTFFLLYKSEEDNAHWRWSILAGAASGYTILTHGFLWAFAGAEILYALWQKRYRQALFFAAGIACAVLPVIFAKSIYYEKFTTLQKNAMFNVWLGHNSRADGGCWMRPGNVWESEHRNSAIEAEKRNISVDRIYIERIIDFYKEQPAASLKLIAKKAWKLILPVEFVSGADSPAMIGKTAVQRYLRFVAAALGLFAIAGIVLLNLRKVDSPPNYIHFYLLSAALAAAQLLTVTSGRYRTGMMPGVLLIAATAVAALKKRQALVALVGTAVIGFMLPPLPEIDAEERSYMGEAFYRKGKFDEADRAFEFASKQLDDPGRFNNLRGIIAEKQGDFRKAAAFYHAAITPYSAEGYFNYGLLLSKHFPEQREEATTFLYAGLQIDQSRADVFNQIGVNLANAGDWKVAELAFALAVNLAPEHQGYRNNLEFSRRRNAAVPAVKTAHPALHDK